MINRARQESELGNLQQIVAGLSEGVILIDPDQTLRWANEAALQAHGVDTIAALGANVSEYRDRFQLRYRNNRAVDPGRYPIDRVVAGETFSEVVVEVFAKGEEAPSWVHQVRSLVLTDEDGDPERLVLIVKDVTEQFEAENRFERAFNANPAPAIICRLSDLRFVRVNRGFLELSGYDRDKVIARSFYELDLFEGTEHRERAKQQLAAGETIPQMEAMLPLADGDSKLVIVAGQPIELADEPCMLFTFADLEPRRKAETALRHSEARFVRTFQMAPIAMMMTAHDGRQIAETNFAFQQLTGHDGEAITGRTPDELGLWENMAVRRSMEADIKSDGGFSKRDLKLQDVAGASIDCIISASVIGEDSQACVLWVIQDISERRHSELELVSAIEAVMKDASWFSQALVEKLANLRTPASGDAHAKEIAELTRREKEVLGLICQGADDAAIATALDMSRNTVRNHVARIYGKIGVNKRGAAIVWARERGLSHMTGRPTK